MKNKAIELAVRKQHGIPEDVDVTVEFVSSVKNKYTFIVTWISVDNYLHTSEVIVTETHVARPLFE